MIAVDTNLLVYAHMEEVTHHQSALHALAGLAGGRRRWGVPWPCIHEFLAVVTNSRIYSRASPMSEALAAVGDLRAARGAAFLGESADHLEILGDLLQRGSIIGPRVHDARIAAICLGHGVDELWTAGRDFSYFPELRTRNPLVGNSQA